MFYPSVRWSLRRLLPAFSMLNVCLLAHAVPVSIVTPNNLTGTEGNVDNSYPFSVAETMRYQQVYAASQFGALAGPGGLITAIAFRPDAVYGYAFTHTIGNIQIDLSTTTAGPVNALLNVSAPLNTVVSFAPTLFANVRLKLPGPAVVVERSTWMLAAVCVKA